jgi:hypothetical protein
MADSNAGQQGAAGKESLARLLTANHRRVLATTLRRVELAAWRLEDQLTRKGMPELALTRFSNPLSAAQKTALLHLVKQLREAVAQLAADYHLAVAEENLLSTVMAEFTLLWCDVEDLRPQKLRAYGEVDPRVARLLELPLQRLIKLLLAVNDVAGGKPEAIRLWQGNSESNRGGGIL